MTSALTRSLQCASTVLVYRQTPHQELFMVKRHGRSAFMANAMVFPGGRMDAADAAEEWIPYIDADSGCANGRGRQIAAIRELFEEAGILLATRDGHELTPDSEYGPTLFERDRKRLNSGTITFLECVRTHRLVLNTTALQPFTRWITPEIETRRFDAHFFTTELPAQQTPLHDQKETTSGQWLSPSTALDLYKAKQIVLAPPTLRILLELKREWSAISRPGQGLTVAMAPQALKRDGVLHLVLPGDPEYLPGGSARNRISRIDGHWISEGRGY